MKRKGFFIACLLTLMASMSFAEDYQSLVAKPAKARSISSDADRLGAYNALADSIPVASTRSDPYSLDLPFSGR
jgi:hypothetical protein